jgi:hypothetical protein
VQDYKTINNKDGALLEGSSRLSDDDTESGCNSSGKKFHNKSRTLLFAAVGTLATVIGMMAMIIMIAILSSSYNNGINTDVSSPSSLIRSSKEYDKETDVGSCFAWCDILDSKNIPDNSLMAVGGDGVDFNVDGGSYNCKVLKFHNTVWNHYWYEVHYVKHSGVDTDFWFTTNEDEHDAGPNGPHYELMMRTNGEHTVEINIDNTIITYISYCPND